MFAFFAGLAAGLLHVFSGPDHLAAVAPLVADESSRPALSESGPALSESGPALSEKSPHAVRRFRVEGWRTGLQWGVGHTAGVLLIATLLLMIREQLPLDAISAYSERLVGVALIAVGAWGIWKANRSSSSRPHSHAGASFLMGTIHGLAGSSHLFGVLPALAFSTRADSLLYLGGFGVGAIAGMSAFAAGLGLLSIKLGGNQRRYSGLLYASSAAALVVGGFWLVGR